MTLLRRQRIAAATLVATASLLAAGCTDDAESGDLRTGSFYPEINAYQHADWLAIDTELRTDDDYRLVELNDDDALYAIVDGQRYAFSQSSDGLHPAYSVDVPGNHAGKELRVVLDRGARQFVSRVDIPRRLVIEQPAAGRTYSFGDVVHLRWNGTASGGGSVEARASSSCRKDNGKRVGHGDKLGDQANDGHIIFDFSAFFNDEYSAPWRDFSDCNLTLAIEGPFNYGRMAPELKDGFIMAGAGDRVTVKITR